MTTGSVDAGRELTADELNGVSGGKGKELESQDRLGNFEIQNLIREWKKGEFKATREMNDRVAKHWDDIRWFLGIHFK